MLSTNVLCLKKRKKRSYYISEASDYIPRPSKDKRSLDSSPAMMQITEDTPPDMLAGAMDLTVHLPTGRTVKMSVERSTPMMDLLMQITTAYHLQHSGHILQALEMAPASGHTDKVLPYKPNTPIGALDTQHVKVIPKSRSALATKHASAGYHQPFESTFRLQVHLPRNQLYVIRVSQNVYLGDIMKKVCDEKNLDSMKYEFRHPGNLDEVLDPKLTLSDYQITEVYVVLKGTVGLTQAFSSNDIMALRKEEERKQLQARTGGGVFSLIFKRGKTSMGSGSLSSENRSISPSHSDESRSVTPPAIQQQILPPALQEPPKPAEKPKPPQRKRRPAPKPPQPADARKDSTEKPPSQISGVSDSNVSDVQQGKADSGLTICHSRNSSDSSGYHEPSVLSDNCNTSLPRRPKSTIINEVVCEEAQAGEPSRSSGNLSKMSTFSKSTTSITSRKKKAAPPPPTVLKSASPTGNPDKASPVVASPPVEKQDLTTQEHTKESPSTSVISSKRSSIASSRPESKASIIQEEAASVISKESLRLSVCSSSEQITSLPSPTSSTSPSSVTSPKTSEANISQITETVFADESNLKVEIKEEPELSAVALPVASIENKPQEEPASTEAQADKETVKADAPDELAELESEWQYQLPSPPTAFRDSSPTNLTDVTNYDTITLQDFKEESVVTNPELFEKLRLVKESETASDFSSVVSEEDKPMLNNLTLENLEKRKSLVYNRELSTSLKIAQENDLSSSNLSSKNADEASGKHSSMLNELEEVIHNSSTGKPLAKNNSNVSESTARFATDSSLPNFKISTYDNPKRKINIFEDDSVRSNVDNSFKTNSFVDLSSNRDFNVDNKDDYSSMKHQPIHTSIGRSMDSIPFRKHSIEANSDGGFKKPAEFAKYKSSARSNFYVKHQKSTVNNVTRSESFSSNHSLSGWRPQNPVQRSKSQVALNRYKDETELKSEANEDGLAKSNSLFDVSGLQSLEVMRIIQTKLNTPNNSAEQLLERNSDKQSCYRSACSTEQKSDSESTSNTKTYRYHGPPAINVSTWSERPKTKVSLKEDTDYRINQKLKAADDSESGKHYFGDQYSKSQTDVKNVSIKINGTEPITTQESGNLVIKIGNSQAANSTDTYSTKYISNVSYRKPLANVNKIEKSVRPHSVAFESDFDISRVPIVRSVELKKPFKESQQSATTQNTTVTQINGDSGNKYSDIYRSTESVNEINSLKPYPKNSSVYLSSESMSKPVVRVNSFAQTRSIPVVMGFRNVDHADNTARSRKSWNVPNSYSTLPMKPHTEAPTKAMPFVANSNVPFSQVTLKRIESNKAPSDDKTSDNANHKVFGNIVLRNTSSMIKASNNNRYSTGSINNFEVAPRKYSNGVESNFPPSPPSMPKVTNITKKPMKFAEPSMDSRNKLLDSIRNFGGMKGLRHVKA